MIAKTGFSLSGEYWDYAVTPDGTRVLLQHGHNIVTDSGLALVAGMLGGLVDSLMYWKVGEGQASWDIAPPTPDGTETALVTPLAEKQVSFAYWDEDGGTYSPVPTNVLDIRVTFLTDEANGSLREFGLFGGTGGVVMFNYVVHGKIIKDENYNLERILRVKVSRVEE